MRRCNKTEGELSLFCQPSVRFPRDKGHVSRFGSSVREWQADFGRTFVLGSDPIKLKLRDDIAKALPRGPAVSELAQRERSP